MWGVHVGTEGREAAKTWDLEEGGSVFSGLDGPSGGISPSLTVLTPSHRGHQQDTESPGMHVRSSLQPA